jgi:hypothetical protein
MEWSPTLHFVVRARPCSPCDNLTEIKSLEFVEWQVVQHNAPWHRVSEGVSCAYLLQQLGLTGQPGEV